MNSPPHISAIALTDSPPVLIREYEWRAIASWPQDGSGSRLKVLRHRDGRSIVYGVSGVLSIKCCETRRGGEVLNQGDDVVAAIRRVGVHCGFPPDVIEACISDL